MSGRRRRSESSWDRKEEVMSQTEMSGKVSYSSFHGDGSPKMSNSEANDVLMSDDFSREPMQGNENMSMNNDNSDRHRMKTDPAFVEWENQYSSRPSDSSYAPPYRGGDRGVSGTRNMSKDRHRSRSRSWSPHQSRGRDRDRSREAYERQGAYERREAYESADVRNDSRPPSRPYKDSRGGGNRMDNNDSTEKWYSGGSRFRDDRNSADRPRHKVPEGSRKDAARNEDSRDYHRDNRSVYDDQDHKRQSNQTIKAPCRFFSMGKCNRINCKYSHDVSNSGGYEGRSHDNNNNRPWNEIERQPQDRVNASGFSDLENSNNRNFDDKNKSWNGPTWNDFVKETSRDCITNDMDMTSNELTEKAPEMLSISSLNGPKLELNGSVQGLFLQPDLQKQTEIENKPDGQVLEASRTDIPQVPIEMNPTLGSTEQVPQISQNINLANALEFLYSLPNSVDPVSSMVVNKSTETSKPNVEQKPVGNVEINEKNRVVEDPKQENMNVGKTETQGKVEEGNIGNEEKAMRQFKIALVEFVKEILKPTWKEGKMSREVYKTIVKKVVDKVTTTIQGAQIPRTQEKIDQYLAFSKPKITKLVEAYVGRFLKA